MAQEPTYRNHAFLIELARHLHNYVAAAYSFSEHVSALEAKVVSETFHTRLKEKIEQAGRAEIGRFFQDLRNYIQHRAPAPIMSELHIKEMPGFLPVETQQRLYMDKNQLLLWDGWKTPSRSFIEKHEGDILLRETARHYLDLLVDLWQWLWKEIRELNEESFQRLDELAEEAAKLYGWEGQAHPRRRSVPKSGRSQTNQRRPINGTLRPPVIGPHFVGDSKGGGP